MCLRRAPERRGGPNVLFERARKHVETFLAPEIPGRLMADRVRTILASRRGAAR